MSSTDEPRVPDDVDEARRMREETREQREKVRKRKTGVLEMAAALARRRGENHFVDLLNFYTKGQ